VPYGGGLYFAIRLRYLNEMSGKTLFCSCCGVTCDEIVSNP
jgi:hypothetical protein